MGCLVIAIAAFAVGAPPGGGSEVPLRLEKDQEFVYRGLYTETSRRAGPPGTRRFELEACVFILNAGNGSADAAFLTVQRPPTRGGHLNPPMARLELARVEGPGRVKFARRPALLRVPPEGPPNLETRAFVELPAGGVAGGLKWEAADDGEGVTSWMVAGLDDQPCGKCLKLIGRQQSDSWARIGTAGWRREDVVWLKLQGGYAVRIERKCENRDDGGDIGSSSVLVMDLETFNPITVPPAEARARQVEIRQVLAFTSRLDDLLQSPTDRHGYATLLALMTTHANNVSPTPYRAALLTLRGNVEAAQAGERPPEPLIVSAARPRPPAEVGQFAPDSLMTDFVTGDTTRLSRLRGQPVMLLLFKPTSPTAQYMLAYADEARSAYAGKMHVLALAVTDDVGAVVQLRARLKLKAPTLDGREAARLFAGDTTPRTVILDKTGTIRFITPAWGGGYPDLFATHQLKDLLLP
jgi:hypothetical protein